MISCNHVPLDITLNSLTHTFVDELSPMFPSSELHKSNGPVRRVTAGVSHTSAPSVSEAVSLPRMESALNFEFLSEPNEHGAVSEEVIDFSSQDDFRYFLDL